MPITVIADDVQQEVDTLVAEYQGRGSEDGADKEVQLQLLVKTSNVGFVIGKGGETINRIKQVSQAQMSFDKQASHSEALLGERKCRIQGTLQACAMAAHVVCGVALRFGGFQQPVAAFVLAPEACGAVVGRKGQNLADLRQSTAAKIQLEPHPHPALGGRLCVITSDDLHSVTHALIRIMQLDSFTPVPTDPGMHAAPMAGLAYMHSYRDMHIQSPQPARSLATTLSTALASLPLGVPQHDFTDRQQVEITCLLPADHTGVIIGKGGNHLATIRTSTNTRLNVERGEAAAGVRRAVLSGQLSAVVRALHMLGSLVGELTGTAAIELVVDENCGMLIGKGGANLKRLRETCRCKVTLEREPSLSDGRRFAVASADPANCTLAAYYALRTLHEQREER